MITRLLLLQTLYRTVPLTLVIYHDLTDSFLVKVKKFKGHSHNNIQQQIDTTNKDLLHRDRSLPLLRHSSTLINERTTILLTHQTPPPSKAHTKPMESVKSDEISNEIGEIGFTFSSNFLQRITMEEEEQDEKKLRITQDLAALRRFLTVAESNGHCDSTLDEILRVFKESVPPEHPSLRRENSIDRTPHVALLFSNPLVCENESGGYVPLDSIPYESEKKILFKAMMESGRAVTYFEEQASVESFRAVLDRGCRVLHFVGHGIQGENKDRDGLLVEGDCGRALEMDVETLSKLLRRRGKSSRSLRLVFVSSCHSQEVGQVFLRAGAAEHVIAVKREVSVLSDAACLFAHAFYRSYLCDSSVHDAFEHAKLQVSATSSFDPSQFVLMSSPTSSTTQDDKVFVGIPPGDVVRLSRKPKFQDIPSKPDVCLESKHRYVQYSRPIANVSTCHDKRKSRNR